MSENNRTNPVPKMSTEDGAWAALEVARQRLALAERAREVAILDALNVGLSGRAIASALGISHTQVQRVAAKAKPATEMRNLSCGHTAEVATDWQSQVFCVECKAYKLGPKADTNRESNDR
jgi:FixJ family two-component response regulator